MNAIDYANLCAALAAQNQIGPVKASLQRAIDYLELANVLMLYGNVSNPVDYAQFMVRQHYVDFLGASRTTQDARSGRSKLLAVAATQPVSISCAST